MTGMIVVSDYDSQWTKRFEELRQQPTPHVRDLAVSIEHVGSTAVPGRAAKPIIDLDIVVSEETVMPELISRLCPHPGGHSGGRRDHSLPCSNACCSIVLTDRGSGKSESQATPVATG